MCIYVNKQKFKFEKRRIKGAKYHSVYLPRDIGVVGKSEVSLMKLNAIIFAMVTEHFTNGH